MKAHTALETVKEMCEADGSTGNVTIIGMPSRLFWLLNKDAARILVDTVAIEKLSLEENVTIKKDFRVFWSEEK